MANKRMLAASRIEKGFTQEAIAREIGISTKTYNHKENGKIPFNSEEIKAITAVLGLQIEKVHEIFLEE